MPIPEFFLGRSTGKTQQSLIARHRILFLGAVGATSLLLLLGVASLVLKAFPNSGDEYAYVFQALTFREGRLWNELHPLQEFFTFNRIAEKDGKWVSQYPPGWALLMALAMLLHLPLWTLNPILGTLTLLVLFGVSARLYGDRVAILTVLAVLFSAFFVFNSASFFSHTLTGLLILAFVYFTLRFAEDNKVVWGILAGAAIGFALTTRPYTAVLCGLPVTWHMISRGRPTVAIRGLVCMAIGASLPLLGLALYNDRITGNPFLMVYAWWDSEETKLGFVGDYDLSVAGRHLVLYWKELVKWGSPTVPLLFLIFFVKGLKDKSTDFVAMTFVLLAVGYAFFHALGGTRYGPRYYYEAYPFMVLFVISRLYPSNIRAGSPTFSWLTRALFFAGMGAGIVGLVLIAKIQEELVSERMDLYDLVQEQKIGNAVVLIKDSTGVVNPMGANELVRNGPSIEGSVLFARYLEGSNEKLLTYYPNRSIYVYERHQDAVHGTLRKLRPPL